MTVYLLHFHEKYKHAQHYIGYATQLKKRIQHHQNGTGARLLQVIQEAGIGWEVARIWPDGDRALERRLKRYHKSRQLCPICNANNGKGAKK